MLTLIFENREHVSMLRNVKPLIDPKGGFTLLEIMAATGLLLIGVMALVAIVVPLSRQREQVETGQAVLIDARSLMEEIVASAPTLVVATYDTQTYDVAGVDGANGDGTTLSVAVDDTTTLLGVTITGSWNLQDHVETLVLTTAIDNS